MDVTDDDVRAIDECFQGMIEFGIACESTETNAIWFANLLTCLLDSTIREYRHLKIGLEKDTGLEAWACRNPLELNIFTKYVLASEADARRFIGDRLIDGIQIFKSFQDWIERVDPNAQTTPLKETLRIAHEQLTVEGINYGRHLSTRELAGKVGLAEDYAHMNKVCSKLVHPTAWSVLAMNDEGELGQLKSILFFSGARHGLKIGQQIEAHVAKNGLLPNP